MDANRHSREGVPDGVRRHRVTDVNGPESSLAPADLRDLLQSGQHLLLALVRPAEISRLRQIVLEEAAALLRTPDVALLLQEETDPSALRVVLGRGALAVQEGEVLPQDGSFEGRVLSSGQAQRTARLPEEPDAYRLVERGLERIGPAMAAPLRTPNSEIGVLLVTRGRDDAPFLERDLEVLSHYSGSAASALVTAAEFDRARQSKAHMDAWRRERELQTWVQRFEAFGVQSGVGLFAWDPGADRTYWGPGVQALLGYLPSDPGGPISSLFDRADSRDLVRVRDAFEQATLWSDMEEIALEARVYFADGKTHPLMLKLARWRTSGATVLGTLQVPSQARGSAETAPASPQPGVVSVIQALRHEINNPLAAVMGQAQLLRGEPAVSEDVTLARSVDTILAESERIATLMKRLGAVGAVGDALRISPLGGLDFSDPAS